MKILLIVGFMVVISDGVAIADETLDAIKKELADLKSRVTALEEANQALKKELAVDRLVVRKELIVSDTGQPWESGFEEQQIPRGVYARSLYDGPGGLWVRSRLIKGEIDDPFDDRFHAIDRNGVVRRNPGHISWSTWFGGAWRQMALLQGEGLDTSEISDEDWTTGKRAGRIRIQTFRVGHDEPLTDALIGQGMMALGGGGYGSDRLPYPSEVLQLWGGELQQNPLATPPAPSIVKDDGSGEHSYAIIAVGPQGKRSGVSPSAVSKGLAELKWDSQSGAEAYIVVRDGKEITEAFWMEGAEKRWVDSGL